MVSGVMKISQEAFDTLVKENMEEFAMELHEALEDAMKTFQLQGVDLKGIVTDGSGSGGEAGCNLVLEAVRKLEDLLTSRNSPPDESHNAWLSSISEALQNLSVTCTGGDPSVAAREGGVEAVMSAFKVLKSNPGMLCPALKLLATFLADGQSRAIFMRSNGPQDIMSLLVENGSIKEIAECACSVIAAATAADEIVKEQFMDLSSATVLSELLVEHASDETVVQEICNAFRSLVTADDSRVAVSKAFSNARKFAEAGMIDSILRAAETQSKSSLTLGELCTALRSLAVNEDICKSVEEKGGLTLVLQYLDALIKLKNEFVAKMACSLLSQLAGSDCNKEVIVVKGGLSKVILIMAVYSDYPSVLQEAMTLIATLSLRSPTNAVKSVKVGALDLIAEAMENHPLAATMQRQACQALRNLAVRSPENRSLILEKGLDVSIREAKANHQICKDAASAALRDLGFDDYL